MNDLQTSSVFYIKKYSVLFEERDRVKIEQSKGNADLGAHLNEFRKKLDNSESDQIKRFDEEFFAALDDDSRDAPTGVGNEGVPAVEEEMPSAKKIHPSWVKKLYRQIVFLTHPDKIGTFPIESIVQKYSRLYHVAIEAYEAENYSDVIMVAGELEIEVPDDKINEYVLPAIKEASKEIDVVTQKIGYQWFHVSPDEREIVLTNYLTQLGYIFTLEQVKDVVRRKSNRKVGQRPVKVSKGKLK